MKIARLWAPLAQGGAGSWSAGRIRRASTARRRRKGDDYEALLGSSGSVQYSVSERELKRIQPRHQPGNTGVGCSAPGCGWMRWYSGQVRPDDLRGAPAVVHGHVLVNGRRVNRPARRLQPGDTVALA